MVVKSKNPPNNQSQITKITNRLNRVLDYYCNIDGDPNDPDIFWEKAKRVQTTKQALNKANKIFDGKYKRELGAKSPRTWPKWMKRNKKIMDNLDGTRFEEFMDYILTHTMPLKKAKELYNEEYKVLFNPDFNDMSRKLGIKSKQIKRYIHSFIEIKHNNKVLKGFIKSWKMSKPKREGGHMIYSVGEWHKTPIRRLFYLKNTPEIKEFLKYWRPKS